MSRYANLSLQKQVAKETTRLARYNPAIPALKILELAAWDALLAHQDSLSGKPLCDQYDGIEAEVQLRAAFNEATEALREACAIAREKKDAAWIKRLTK